jgi:hypothetical protein
MGGERDYLRTFEVGRRNQEVKILIQNWCGHARIEKIGGTGIIEAETGFPIGHHFMACDHAPAGGSATWYLEDAALQFYDRNCVSCKFRQPLRLPNLVELVRRRDQLVASREAELEREKKKLREEYDARQAVRAALHSKATVPVASLIEDIQLLDQNRTEEASEKIVATARLAPEVFNAMIVEHLFCLIEADESWATETALRCLLMLAVHQERLVVCAMRCLSQGRNAETAAEILCTHLDLVEVSQVQSAVKSLCFLAAPPRGDFDRSEPESRPEALRALASRFPGPVEKALDILIASSTVTDIKVAARAIPLIYRGVVYPGGLIRSLAAKLTRVDSLVDSDRDSEIDRVAHELGRALVYALLADDQRVDTLLASYYQGASSAGEARIAGVYSNLLRLPDNRFESVDTIPDLRPYGTALRRLLQLASTTKNPDVIQYVQEAFRYFPEQLSQVACEHMDSLLGTAALVDQALTDFMSLPVGPKEANNFLAQLERSNNRQRLAGLRGAILEWASSAAAANPAAAAKFIDFIASDVQWPEQFRSALIKALPPLMDTAASTNAVLPFLYGAMVGESALVRMAAARALRELRSSRMHDLPDLVHDAFLLLLSDPIIGVHQSAVEALERISLPEEYDSRITARLMAIFAAYAHDTGTHDEFVVTCIGLLVHHLREKASFSTKWGPIFVVVLLKVDDMMLLRHGRFWMLRQLVNVEGFPDLLMKLLHSAEHNEHYDDEMVSLLRELPVEVMLGMRASLVALCEQLPNVRILAAACIEVLGVAGAWDATVQIANCSHDSIADSTRMRLRKQYAQLTLLATLFEQHLAEGRQLEALRCAGQWRQIHEEVECTRSDE